MLSIEKYALPDNALLGRYARDGIYSDCYATEVAGTIAHAEYVTAFYTTSIFKLERAILTWVVAKPSTDDQARQLAEGSTDTFAAWYVEERCENQILLCDFRHRTRSWLMVAPVPADRGARTRLYFGSAVVPVQNSKSDVASLGVAFHAVLGFHKLYSVALLSAARSRLRAGRR